MVDNVNIRLFSDDVGGVNLMDICSKYLDNTTCKTNTEIDSIGQSYTYYSNKYKNLTIRATPNKLFIGDGSWCKFLLDDNIQTLGRQDVQRVVEILSDKLHLPIDKAKVTRLDVGVNLITKLAPERYMGLFGQYLKATKRTTQNSHGIIETIEYFTPSTTLCIYNKINELKKNNVVIPKAFANDNILRFELRFMNRVKGNFGTDIVRASNLYDEQFYIEMIDKLHDAYTAIEKINNVQIDVAGIEDVADLKNLALANFIEQYGLVELKAGFRREQINGNITRFQLARLNKALTAASKARTITRKDNAIEELDRLIDMMLAYYR
jgi:DNA-dependent RNA polymerase auxiliary subunit epsilon